MMNYERILNYSEVNTIFPSILKLLKNNQVIYHMKESQG